MGQNLSALLDSDRIVEINGCRFIVHDTFSKNRRNVICHSNMLESYIKSNNLSKTNYEHIILIGQMLKNFNDIKVVKIDGYY